MMDLHAEAAMGIWCARISVLNVRSEERRR